MGVTSQFFSGVTSQSSDRVGRKEPGRKAWSVRQKRLSCHQQVSLRSEHMKGSKERLFIRTLTTRCTVFNPLTVV